MNKFENVDVLASLQQIMQQNTAAFFRAILTSTRKF